MNVVEQLVWTAQSIGESVHLITQALARGDRDSVWDLLLQIEAWAGELGYTPAASPTEEDPC